MNCGLNAPVCNIHSSAKFLKISDGAILCTSWALNLANLQDVSDKGLYAKLITSQSQ